MSTLPETELRTALYERLIATGYKVFFATPYEEKGYYYVLADIISGKWNTKSGLGFEAHVYLHCWDARVGARTAEQVEAMNNAAVEAITTAYDAVQNYLSLASFDVIRQDLEQSQTFADGAEMPHGITEYSFLLTKK